jgi:H+/Cl- antiporter ClcA
MRRVSDSFILLFGCLQIPLGVVALRYLYLARDSTLYHQHIQPMSWLYFLITLCGVFVLIFCWKRAVGVGLVRISAKQNKLKNAGKSLMITTETKKSK